MGDFGLLKQGWKWARCRKQAFMGARTAASCGGDKLGPAVYRWGVSVGKVLLMLMLQWRDCVVRGLASLIGLGSAALFVIMWSCFLSLTSASNVVYVLLILLAAGAAIRCLGYTPGLAIVGLFGILIMWMFGNLWITGMMFIVGGYMFSLNHARVLIFISIAYAVYYVNVCVGWLGVILSLNLSFLSHDLLNRLIQGYDGINQAPQVDEHKESEPEFDDFLKDCDYSSPSPNEAENVASCKPSCDKSDASNISYIRKDASSSKVVKADSASLDEMKKILDSCNHYEALGLPRNTNINVIFLKKEYHKKAILVHPDKNMGNPLASESFKKLQCAYEVLSDSTKKKNYDEQLRKDESGRVCQKFNTTSHQDGMDYRSEESRRIECSKCGNSHIWICTSRSKARARWCQDCSLYHQARDGDGWVEYGCSPISSLLQKVEIPRAFVCAESKIFDVSEWAICQGMVCRPNTHQPSFHVKVGLDRPTQRSNPSRFSWGFDAELTSEDCEYELWLQRALASGFFSEAPKRRKSWSPFKIHQKGMKSWWRSP